MATSAVSPEKKPEDPPRRRLRTKLLVAAGVAVLLGASAGGALLYGTRVNAKVSPALQEPVKPIFVPIEPVTVNLNSDGKKRFLHLGISLKVKDETSQARVAQALPELRSRLLLLLSNRDPETFSSPEDKLKLAAEIRSELDRPLAAGQPFHGLSGIVFNAFVVQ